jgi:hypothetical protein
MKEIVLKAAASRRKARGNVRARKLRASAATDGEVLSQGEWTAGAIAWNKEGNIVILDPRLAQYLRQRARDDREIEIGIPTRSTKVERRAGGEKDYDPYPESGSGVRPIPDPKPLGLCVCEYLRFHLAAEGPALHQPLMTEGLNSTMVR